MNFLKYFRRWGLLVASAASTLAHAGVRLTGWQEDLPQLSNTELAGKNSMEWWYFDLQTQDGKTVVLILAKKNTLITKSKGIFQVEYKDKSQSFKRVHLFNPKSFYLESGTDRVEWGFSRSNRITMSYDPNTQRIRKYDVAVDVPGFHGSFSFVPRHQGFMPGNDGCYLFSKSLPIKKSCAHFAAPRMWAQGSFHLGKQAPVDFSHAEGYHDHPWATDHFIHTHNKWHWARLYSPEITLMYAQVFPQKAYEGGLNFAYLAKENRYEPRVSQDAHIQAQNFAREGNVLKLRFPHDLRIQSGDLNLDVHTHFRDVLSDIPLYNRSLVSFELEETSKRFEGEGWTEYVEIPGRFPGVLATLTRLQYWFSRK